MQSIDHQYEQAALDLYASLWEAFRYVLLPLMIPGIISGFLLAFIISMDDFIITNFVKGAGIENAADCYFWGSETGYTTQYYGYIYTVISGVYYFVTLSWLVGRMGEKSK